MQNIAELENQVLLRLLKQSLGTERRVLGDFLYQLAEVDRRRLYADEGYSSLFTFCMEGLGLKEGESYLRIRSARLDAQYPGVIDRIANGRLSMSILRLLAPHLTKANAEELFDKAMGLSTRAVEKFVSGLTLPAAAQQAPLLALAEPMANPALGAPAAVPLAPQAAPAPTSPAPPVPEAPAGKPDRIRYLNPERVEVKFSADEALLHKLERVKGLMRGKGVGAKWEDVIDHVLESYLDRHDPVRKAVPHRRRALTARRKADSRYIPQRTKDIASARDESRCTFVTSDGRRCSAVTGLQYDHIEPYALGGSSTDPENIRLRCQAHNRLAAERAFGAAKIHAMIRTNHNQG